MADLPPDVVARGRAIFERLRGTTPGTAPADGGSTDARDKDLEPTPPTPPPAADETAGQAPATGEESHDDDGPAASDATEEAPAALDLAPPPPADGEETTAADPVDEPVRADDDQAVLDVAPPPPSLAEEPPAPTRQLELDARAERAPAPAAPTLEPVLPLEPAAGSVDDESRAGEPPPATTPIAPALDRFARPLPRVIAVANQKGGVGKTTTTVNLSACLADLGYRVLVVDLDPQGNASTGLGINIRDLASSLYDVLLRDAELEDCVEPTSVRNLFVAPANLDLAGAEIELVPAFSRELKLRAALESVLDDYDYVFIDCPPSLGLLTVNGLAAAGEVLVPIQCEYYALEGLGQLLRNVTLVQKNLNPSLEVSVIVPVMYDARTKLAEQVVQEVRAHFGDKVCRTVIPRTVRLSEAPSYGQPISAFDPTSRGAIAYRELAKEVSGGPTAQRAR